MVKKQEIEFMDLNQVTQFWIILGVMFGFVSFIWLLLIQSQISNLPHKVCHNETMKVYQTDEQDIKIMNGFFPDYSKDKLIIVGDIKTTIACNTSFGDNYCEEIATREVCSIQ